MEVELKAQDGAWHLVRKDKTVMTPAGVPYAVPTEKLGLAIAEEWRAQDDKKIVPQTMPMTQLAATTIDLVRKEKDKVSKQIAAYAGSDLLCHRAETPADLATRQHKVWQPYLDWMDERWGIRLVTGTGIVPLLQPKASLDAAEKLIGSLDLFWLTGLRQAVDVSGSLALGCALAFGWKDAEAVFHAAELDAEYQSERWGEDSEETARKEIILRELHDARRWFDALEG